MIYRALLLIVPVVFALCVTPDPKGHLKPLGFHPPLHSVAVMERFPSPQYFYEWFVKSSQPVLFRSVLNTIDYPAYKKWNDDYLREHFGDQEVTTERGKKETRNQNDTFFWKFNSFLDRYQNRDLYTVADLTHEMKEDIPILPCITCGGIQNALAMVVMWFSSGGTKSVLHSDSLDNINCLLDGSKDLIFIDKIHKSRVETTDFVKSRGYSKVDIDKVDLLRFPQLENIPWIHAHMVKGDCLFIPNRWYHQVNSYGNRNLAVNVWFHHISWFNQSECDNEESGKSYNSMANYNEATDNVIDKLFIQERFDGLSDVYKDEFFRRMAKKEPVETLNEVFKFLDTNDDDVITWDELSTFDVNYLLEKYRMLFEPLDLSDEEIQEKEKIEKQKPHKDKDEF